MFADLETYGPAVHGELRRQFDSSCHGLQTARQFVAPVGFLLAEMLAECRQMNRQSVHKIRSQNYRRLSGGAKLDAGLVSAVGVKSYTHVLGVIWVGVGQTTTVVAGTTGEGAAKASVRFVGVGSGSHCCGGHNS